MRSRLISNPAIAALALTLYVAHGAGAAKKTGDTANLAQDRYIAAIRLDQTREALIKLVEAQKAKATTAPPGMPIADDRFEAGLLQPTTFEGNGR